MSEEELETIEKSEPVSGPIANGSPAVDRPQPTGDELSIKLVTDSDSFDAFQNQWDDLVDVADSYFYQTFDWNRTWWNYFGEGRDLHIILLFHDDEMVGIAPMFLDTIRVMGRKVDASLRFIGSIVSQPEGEELIGLLPYSDYLDFVVRPGYEQAFVERVVPYLGQSNPDFDSIVLDELPRNSVVWDHLIPALEKEGFEYRVKEASTCPVVRLDGDWDDYLKGLSKSSRYQARRNVKLARKDSHKIFDVYDAGEDELLETYDEFVRLHQQRWNHIGFPGTFGEKRMYDFMRDVVSSSHSKGRLSLKKAVPTEEGESTAAVDLIFRYKDRVYLMHRALDDDSAFIDDSPGNVLLNVAIKEAADSGKKVFDFLRGTESFKFRTANDSVTNRTLTIQSESDNSRIVSNLATRWVALRRRLNVESLKLRLFMDHETEKVGITGYLAFLKHRFRQKWSAD